MAHLSDRRAASVERLQTIKDVTAEDAEAIRKAWRTIANRGDARAEVDRILRTHGVEYLGVNRRTGEHVYYCNTGDTYAQTVLFAGLSLTVGNWGDLIERNTVKPAQGGF